MTISMLTHTYLSQESTVLVHSTSLHCPDVRVVVLNHVLQQLLRHPKVAHTNWRAKVSGQEQLLPAPPATQADHPDPNPSSLPPSLLSTPYLGPVRPVCRSVDLATSKEPNLEQASGLRYQRPPTSSHRGRRQRSYRIKLGAMRVMTVARSWMGLPE